MAHHPEPLTLDEISDRINIQSLLTEYSTAFELGDWDRYAAVFTEDAVLDFSAAGGPRAGVAEATRWVAAAMAPVTVIQQLVGNHVITVSGDTATSRCTFQEGARRRAPDGSENFLAVGGWYDDQLRRTDRGWRITQRVETIAWVDGEMPEDLPGADSPT